MEPYCRYPVPYANMAALNNLTTETISVPDRMVGLIIGKGGEQIAAIQQDSDCRIQFAQDANGSPDRQCTLTGTAEALRKAKEHISRVLNKNDLPSSGQLMQPQMQQPQQQSMMIIDGQMMIEMMIPGNKAGIIIGKGGETIKQLQEQAGVKMIIIQDSNTPSAFEKPLRITGDRINCQKARDMVNQLLSEKNGMNNSLDYNTQLKTTIEIAVPRSMIGIVIGKQGDMIKKIQSESGARIQFKQDDDPNTQSRLCTITGNQEQAQTANNTILELINNSRSSGNDWSRNKSGAPDPSRTPKSDSGKNETTYSVPAEKCGLVIGKGGDSIRDICRNSGAHVELIRDHTSTTERIFRIQGSQDQIQNAIQLISDRAGIVHSQEMVPSTALLSNSALSIANLNGQMSALSIQPQPAAIQHVLPSAYWSATNQFPTYAQPTALAHMQDISKQSDAMTAWITCYQQLGQQPTATLQTVPKQISPYAALARANITPQPMLNPQTGQLDYSAAWADYYRQQGMYQQAQAIMQATNHPQQLQ